MIKAEKEEAARTAHRVYKEAWDASWKAVKAAGKATQVAMEACAAWHLAMEEAGRPTL